MKSLLTRSELARRYLIPMGIESWEPRPTGDPVTAGSVVEGEHKKPIQPIDRESPALQATRTSVSRRPATEADAENADADAAALAGASVAKALVEESADKLEKRLGDTCFRVLQVGRQPQLCLLLEDGECTDSIATLLAAMLKAINLSFEEQLLLTADPGGQLLSSLSLSDSSRPAAAVLMARLQQPSALDSLNHLRNRRNLVLAGMPMQVSLHPDDLLANAAAKRPAWEDLKTIKKILEAQPQ